jgi:hypothetical protein
MGDIFETLAFVLLVAIIMFAFGMITGVDLSSKEWRNDCEKVGKHLSLDKVYFCFPEGGK